MGGDIFVSSERGRGSTFRFDLLAEPGDRSAGIKAERRRVLRLRPAYLGMRVLIADDKAENRDLLEQILRPAGFDTLAVEDGDRAVEVFSEWHPKIALFDLRMPGMDGFEVIRMIRALPNGSRTPIVAVTASAFEENRRDVIAAGGDDFLGKPFRDTDLFEKIARLTGAEYEYEAEPEKNDAEAVGAMFTSEQVCAVIPEELRARIAQAALRADFDEMLATIAEVSAHSPEIADELRRKVECFEYQALIDLIQEESLPA
jgi:CheY-like chemotaxis protein